MGAGVIRRGMMRAAAALALLCALVPASPAQQDTRKKQQIQFSELASRVVGDAPIILAAKSSSGLPITYLLVSGPAVLDGATLRLTNSPGLVIVRASQGGNDLFLPATPAERAFAVNPRPVAPAILEQPSGTRTAMGDIIMLSVEASGEPKPSFQWRRDGSPIAGATESRLTVASATQADAGAYDVVVTNPLGTVTSERANVTVGKRSQTVTFQGATSAVAGQAVMLVANASSGLPVRFDVISGFATLSGTTMTASQAGTVVVQASQGGDTTFDPAVPATQTFLITAGLNGQHIP